MSQSDSSSSGTRPKRTTSSLYLPQTSTTSTKLDVWVSQWTKEEVKKELHIYYRINATTPSSVLEKLACEELNENQSQYVSSIKNYLKFHVNHLKDFFFKARTEPLKENFTEIKKRILADPDRFLRGKLIRFVRSVERLMSECAKCSLKKKIYEGTFTHFVGEFAELCCLQPWYALGNAKNEQAIWENFRGLKSVFSTPDIRLLKEGLPDEDSGCTDSKELIVSVVEFKKESELEFLWREAGKSKLPTVLEDIVKKMELSKIQPTISSSSSSESSSAGSFSKTIGRKKKSTKKTDSLEIDFLHTKVLGQHAGELLFDLNKCLQGAEITDEKIFTMPGMIVDGIKVMFTMLEISGTHLIKLRENTPLGNDDKAVIYYSVDFNILNQEHRDILLENFMRLNNLRTYEHDHYKIDITQDSDSAYSSEI